MTEQDIVAITKIGGRHWSIAYLLPQSCMCMPPMRKTIKIESEQQPTKKDIIDEIANRNKGL